MAEPLTIRFPLPPRDLQPNARPHWRTRAIAKAGYRQGCAWSAMVQTGNVRPCWPRARVTLRWFVADKRGLRADPDNRLAACKAAIDSLTDAGIIEDDRDLEYVIGPVAVDAAEPRVELTIEPREAT